MSDVLSAALSDVTVSKTVKPLSASLSDLFTVRHVLSDQALSEFADPLFVFVSELSGG